MNTITTNDKIITIFGTSMMMVIGSASILYILQQLFPQQQAQAQAESIGSPWLSLLGLSGYSTNMDYGANFEVLHVGEAPPGTLNSVPGWRIYRYGYVIVDGDPEISEMKFASGNKNFDKVWDERATYDYS
jgi:hypothetical protein